MAYITIVNWEKFQHYKDRRPTWVKLLIEIIEEFDADGNQKKYYLMPDNAKTTFLHLLCLRANYNEKIPYPNDKWLKKRLGLRRITLQPLIDAGFIIIDTEAVSKPYSSVQSYTESAHQRESKSNINKSKRESNIYVIFEHWNLYKGQGNWKSHREVTPEIEEAINKQLKKYSIEQLKAAITNYSDILLSPQFVWSKNWTLREFLTRHRPDDRNELQIYRFLQNNFSPDDFKRKEGFSRDKTDRSHIRQECKEKILEAENDKLIAVRQDVHHKDKVFLIDEIRPEIKDEILAKQQP